MRYYDIRMTDPDGALLKQFGFAKFGHDTSYTSYLNGATLPGALNVEFSIPQAPYATPQQGSWLRIWGVGLDELANCNVLGPSGGNNNGDIRLCGITIQGGMKKGLPLAKPEQAGLLTDGSIFRPFGNWQMTDQWIEMILLPAVGVNVGQQINLPFNYPSGTSFEDAIRQSLAAGLPRYTVKINISPSLKLAHTAQGVYKTLNQFSAMILKLSLDQQFQGIKPVGGGQYGGVQFRIIGRTITVYDGTSNYGANSFSNPKKIAFEDIIGQPTWTGPNSINFKCVLRGDINVGDYVTLPTTLAVPYVLSTPGASVPGAPSRNSLTFKGSFVVINVRHVGNAQNSNADSWCTVYNASYVGNPGSLIANPGS